MGLSGPASATQLIFKKKSEIPAAARQENMQGEVEKAMTEAKNKTVKELKTQTEEESKNLAEDNTREITNTAAKTKRKVEQTEDIIKLQKKIGEIITIWPT